MFHRQLVQDLGTAGAWPFQARQPLEELEEGSDLSTEDVPPDGNTGTDNDAKILEEGANEGRHCCSKTSLVIK